MGLEQMVGADGELDTDAIIAALSGEDDDDDGAGGEGEDIEELLSGLDEIVGGDEIVAGAAKGSAMARLALALGGKKRGGGIAALLAQAGALTRGAKKKAALRAALKAAAIKRSQPTLLQPQHNLRGVTLPVTFASPGLVGAGASVLIPIVAPTIWKPYDLLVPSDVAQLFAIAGLTMGIFTFNPGGQPLRMLSFTEDATSRRAWVLPTMQAGQAMNMLVTNTSATPSPVYGEWWGKMIG
jgi:hypothetical protein